MSSTDLTIVHIDIHSEHIRLEAIQDELRVNPSRLEEEKEGKTPLMSSAEFGNDLICEFLLSLGANVEAKSEVLIFIDSLIR